MRFGPVILVFFALSCAPDMLAGALRLAHFKSLLGPNRMRVFSDEPLLRLESESRVVMPARMGALPIAYTFETIRVASAYHIRLVRAGFDRSKEELPSCVLDMPNFMIGIMPNSNHKTSSN